MEVVASWGDDSSAMVCSMWGCHDHQFVGCGEFFEGRLARVKKIRFDAPDGTIFYAKTA